jgi:predicted ATPase
VIRSPLVGRADTLATLDDVVSRAIDFQAPQLVTIIGNQGTGKTRLLEELVARIAGNAARPCRVFHGRAERDAAGQPVLMSALATLLRDRFELTPDPDEASRLRFSYEVKGVMGTDQVAEALCFLGAFVGLSYPPTPFLRAIADNPKLSAELSRTVLRRFLELDAGHGPLVLVLDDMQWADPETLALVPS